MRKLASIQRVDSIEPIANADAIERIRVLGWSVVVKKGEFKIGDQIVYCEIDCLLPIRPEFEFLRPSSYKPAQSDAVGNPVLPEGFRIKTIKLRGQVSQGICFPLSILPSDSPAPDSSDSPRVLRASSSPDSSVSPRVLGCDVTSELGILKWEPPLPAGMGGKVKGQFPGFLSKTDETRVQVLQEVLKKNAGKTFYITEKLDGTSFSAFLWQGEFGVCSRNLWLDETDMSSLHSQVAHALDLKTKLEKLKAKLGCDLAIQAEVIGPGIQKNKYQRKNVELWVFNMLNLSTGKLFDFHSAQKELADVDLKFVPDLGTIVLHHTVDELVEISEGVSILNKQTQREGIILRPLQEEHDETLGGRLSFKVINPKFLLKYDE